MADADAIERQKIRDAIAPPGRMGQTRGEDPIDDPGRRSLMVDVVRGRLVLQTSGTMGLKPTLLFVETVPIHPLPTTHLRIRAQLFGELHDQQTLMSQLCMSVFGLYTRRTHDLRHKNGCWETSRIRIHMIVYLPGFLRRRWHICRDSTHSNGADWMCRFMKTPGADAIFQMTTNLMRRPIFGQAIMRPQSHVGIRCI